VDLLSVALEAAYFAIFGTSLVRFLRRRTALERDVLAAFSAYAVVFTISTLVAISPALRPISLVAAIALLAQPYATLRLLSHFAPVSRGLGRLAVAAFVTSAAAEILSVARSPLVLVYVVACFVAVEAVAARRFWVAGQGRIGVPRLRLGLAAGATALFAVAVVVAYTGTLAAHGGPLAAEIVVTARLGVLGAGLGYLAAFAPPVWLRSLLYRASAFDLVHELVASPTNEEARLWDRLAATVAEILGACEVTIVDEASGLELATTRSLPREEMADPAPGDPGAPGDGVRPGSPGTPGGTGAPAAGRSPDGGPTGSRRVVRVPLMPAATAGPTVAAIVRDTPLFEDDDLALVALLGSTTVRAVERERALVDLAEARSSLAEARAREASEIRFRALVDADPSGVLVADADGRIVFANAVAAGLFGYSVAELSRLSIDDLMPPSGGRAQPAPWAAFAAGSDASPVRSSRELRAVRSDGTRFPIEVARNSFDSNDRILTIAVVADITERRAAEEVRETFLGMLSHELRTPVTSIYGGAHLLLGRSDRLGDGTSRDVLADMAAEAERLQRIVENLLVLAHVERGADIARAQPVPLARLLPPLIDRERTLWPGTEFRLLVDPNLPLVAGDDEYLTQILRNLLSNAAKYGGAGGPVEIEVMRQGNEGVVRVADRGPGFPAENAERLFELYFREPSTSTTAPGAGIGLFVCRKLAHAMGGTLEAAPRTGGGAEFSLRLAAYVDDEPVPAPIPEPAARDAARLSAAAS
jgi:PAS domain S-box-containing protein